MVHVRSCESSLSDVIHVVTATIRNDAEHPLTGFCPSCRALQGRTLRAHEDLAADDAAGSGSVIGRKVLVRPQSAALKSSARWTEAGQGVFRVIPDRCC